jgi:shikimate kinase
MECVYLVGFMGSGKSTVGRLVAERLELKFVDLDERIEEHEGQTVQEIFRDSGEQRFREIEAEALRRVSTGSRKVVAVGGGTYANPENRNLIGRTGTAVYLEAALETILKRVEADGSRPLFSNLQQVRTLYEERLPSYQMAPVRIAIEGLGPDEVAELVVGSLERS